MRQIYLNLQVIPISIVSSMSSPLDFQTEGPGFESHQGHILVFIFFLSPNSLQNAQILMNVVFFVLSKVEISTRGTFSSIAIEI